MNNIIIKGIFQLTTYSALSIGLPSYNDIPEPQRNYTIGIPNTLDDNTISSLPILDTYNDINSNIEVILSKFIHSVIANTVRWDDDIADFINKKFWDLI